MGVFDFSIPSQLKFGVDCVNRIGNAVNEFGNKAILVTEGVLHESELIDRVVEILKNKNCKTIVFDEVVMYSGTEIVNDGAELARSAYADVVIGMGGVRALSIAKCIAALSTNAGNIERYIDGDKMIAPPLPYIEIPSTPRNPFMFTDNFCITDIRYNNAVMMNVPRGTTKFVLFDPLITTTINRRQTAAISIDILSNAIEGFLSVKSNYLSDTLFLKAIELISQNIFKVVNAPDDIIACSNISMAGMCSCVGLAMSSPGITTALSFVLNAKFKIHKSMATAIILPHVLDYNITAVPEKLVKICQALGEDISGLSVVEAAIKAIEKVRRIIIELQLPVRLIEFDLNKDSLNNVADDARKFDFLKYIPRSCDSEELYSILESAY